MPSSHFQILVKPINFIFEACENETVLEAAIRSGYFFPHLCCMGVCGTCKGIVLQGEIEYIRSVTGLKSDEEKSGHVLFCSVKPKSDLVIEVNDFARMDMSSKESIYDVESSARISKNMTQLILRPSTDSHLIYQAGQYIQIIHSDGTGSYLSIANAPRENAQIELHLAHPLGNLPAQDILRIASDEKKYIVRGPLGSCVAGNFYTERPVIFLARGTGFAPVKAMIEEIIQFKKYPAMHVYWSVSTPEEFYIDELLQRWTQELNHFSLTPVLSRPYPGWNGKVGLLQNVIIEDYPDIANSLVYASAPEPIVHDVLHVLQSAGLPREHYFSDVLG